MNKVFLGGTCNDSKWRSELIPMLEINYFNPVVADWTEECQSIENIQKEEKCNVHLYVITAAMTGVFSIAEAVNSACTKGKIVIFHVMPDGFTKGQLKSLVAVVHLIRGRGGIAYVDRNIQRTSKILNNCFDNKY